ncbi:MAG TPA: bifunctional alpha,alpha-trehalose-phosphate synthase (UDP-forming)/trehalose-phosphatase [Bacteriovoracaceae bacterium]|nr:bifunctional alpha,alpha-trehalose-phosphate synthase (UDP-forming)/trehalose-phosphatase [Bacteriovoracaceae bacterium]
MARCLLVSNRLPVAYNEKTNAFDPSSGGLVSAIKGLDPAKVGYNFQWMGIMTDDVEPARLEQLKSTMFGDIKCHPIVVPKQTYNSYYNKYCNNVLWPLFHYDRSMVHHSLSGWKAYQEINRLVAESIIAEAKEDDTVWVHDFQLLLVPGYVKQKRPDIKLSFFLHIPFPSSEIFRELPQRKEVLQSLLTCDLLGFHDLSYLTHFKTCVTRILGASPENTSDRKWGVYPISIDTAHFERTSKVEETRFYVNKYMTSKGNMKWILGVDRLDYIKGLTHKFRAFKAFLKRYPEHIGHVQMVQVVIPSRTDVVEYQRLKERIEQMVSSINGEFGSPIYTPVHYLYHSVSENELSALYQVSDVLHVGSLRDGMNLVSLEYVASQRDGLEGSILLSEFTGAHSTLSYAFSINPWDIEGTAASMKDALFSPEDVRRQRMHSMQLFLRKYTSSDWAQVFLRDLYRESRAQRPIVPVTSEGLFSWMKNLRHKRVLFFCDLDGTLLPISNHPSQVRMGENTARLLQEIGTNDKFQFVIVSGRDKEFLEDQFVKRNYQFALAACHGAYSYSRKEKKWDNLVPNDGSNWRENVLEVLKLYTIRTPGSFIEDKGHAITWHYRSSPSAFAEFLSNKLYIELEEALTSQPVQVTRGKKVIEVKSIHANKGTFVRHWINQLPEAEKPDVIIALGDDTTDEDMFRTLQDQNEISAYCIKVGDEATSARYYIKDQENVDPLLERMLTSLGGIDEKSFT